MLAQAVRTSRNDAGEINARRVRCAKRHNQIEEDFRTAVAKARRSSGIHATNLCATLGEVLPRNAIYVDETTSHRGQVHKFVQNYGWLSFVRVPSGLGQCLGVCLGIKIACPDRPVVALIGDGAFVYNPVVAALAFAKQANVPIMVILFNNGGYRGMRDNHLTFYPDGVAARHDEFCGETLHSSDYDELAKAFGAVGIRVEDPSTLRFDLQRGYDAVKSGKLALVNVLLEA
jgi:acetolactate synthase-1/2/3 large subunit